MGQVQKFFLIIFCLGIFGNQKASPPQEESPEMRGGDRPSFHITPRPARKTNPSSPRTTSPSSPAQAELTIIILVQASNNLESFAHKNMKEIMKWGSTPLVNILVDLHKTGDKSWRYKIEQGCLVVEEVLARDANASIADEVVDTARWAITKYPAKKYAVIFWNHGLGCLDPLQDKKTSHLQPYNDFWRLSPLLGTADTTGLASERLSRALAHSIPADRSILFDDERNTYLSNEGLNTALKTISQKLLDGKKIDLIGMDACLMGMLEIADQIKDYASYFVASEEFEFAQGWPYGDIIGKITAQPTMSAKDIGKLIVNEFGAHYSNRTSYFTLACIDLAYIKDIKECIHSLSQALLAAKKTDPERTRLFIQQARCQALSFSLSDYIDAHSFCKELTKLTTYILDNPRNKTTPTPQLPTDLLKKIQVLANQGACLINTAALANTTGRYLARAQGLSIYFPQRVLDRSYASTIFAQTTDWPTLIAGQLDKR